MSYNPSIPGASDLISNSQAQIQTNFAQLDTVFDADHYKYSAATNNGKHKKATLVQQVADPGTAVNEVALYTKALLTGAVTEPEIYVQQQSNGTVFLLTRGAPVPASGEGVAYGGLQIRSGNSSILAGNLSQAISFSSKFETAVTAITFGPITTNTVIQVLGGTVSASGFTATRDGVAGVASFYWIAIGY